MRGQRCRGGYLLSRFDPSAPNGCRACMIAFDVRRLRSKRERATQSGLPSVVDQNVPPTDEEAAQIRSRARSATATR